MATLIVACAHLTAKLTVRGRFLLPTLTQMGVTMNERDRLGRFTCGNQVCYSGWAGLVAGPFQGDKTAARAWIAQLGRHTYARQCIGGTVFEYRLNTIWRHPGTCAQFLVQWRESLSFTLADVQEVQP